MNLLEGWWTPPGVPGPHLENYCSRSNNSWIPGRLQLTKSLCLFSTERSGCLTDLPSLPTSFSGSFKAQPSLLCEASSPILPSSDPSFLQFPAAFTSGQHSWPVPLIFIVSVPTKTISFLRSGIKPLTYTWAQ